MKKAFIYFLLTTFAAILGIAAFAQQTDESLTTQVNVIRNETSPGGNTKTRIADMYQSIIDSKLSLVSWQTSTVYTANKSSVIQSNKIYKCLITHTAGTFATDLAANRWVEISESTGGGGGSFSTITGDPYDNTNLAASLNEKADALLTVRSVTGAYTLNSTDLGIINAGGMLEVQGNSGGALTIPLNSSVAFPVGSSLSASGFTGSVIATGGVTVTGSRGDLVFPSGGSVFLQKTGTNTWTLNNGNLTQTVNNGATTTTPSEDAVFDFVTSAVSAASVADGDKGDITVSSSGSVWTIDNSAVTNSKINDVAIGKVTGLGTGVATFLTTPSSANLASAVTDETGTGVAVFSNAPTLTNPVVGTQSSGDNSTKAASTAYVDALTVLPTGSLVVGAGGVSTPFAIGSANQILGVNTGGTTVEYKTAGDGVISSSGAIGIGGAITAAKSFTGAFDWSHSHARFVKTSTFTTTATDQIMHSYTGTTTTRATTSDNVYFARWTPTISMGAASQTAMAWSLSPTLNTNNLAASSFTGIDYNPTITVGSGSLANHYAIRATSGNVVFGGTTGLTGDRLSVYGISGNRIARLYNSAGSNRFVLYDDGRLESFTATLASSTTIWDMQANIIAGSGTNQTFTSWSLRPTYNLTGVFTGQVYGIDYNPTMTSLTGTTMYGMVIRPQASLNGFGTSTPTSTLDVNGSFSTAANSSALTTNTTLDNTRSAWAFSTASGNITVSLPDATACVGREYMIVNTSASNTLEIDPNGSQAINGVTTNYAISGTAYSTITIKSFGALGWIIRAAN